MKRLNSIHRMMIQRCYNNKRSDFERYGGRGITICNEWYTPGSWEGWRTFKDWALANGYADDLTIDRIDVNKGYSPDNCRWVTQKEQGNNTRRNRYITYKGKTQTLAQWCEELHLNYNRISARINMLHWPVEKALETVNQRPLKR